MYGVALNRGIQMSRYTSEGAYGFKCQKINEDVYEICWTVDFFYASSRLRFPRRFRRDTNNKGSRIFCKKHGITSNET